MIVVTCFEFLLGSFSDKNYETKIDHIIKIILCAAVSAVYKLSQPTLKLSKQQINKNAHCLQLPLSKSAICRLQIPQVP